ncbi:decaprenyl-phosphate phosphoribosyltransferase [soil metagenome]
MSSIAAALLVLRPKQWTKNLLVFAALVFTGNATDKNFLIPTVIAFAAMCLASSATYIYNDIQDRERDRAHPKKKKRPIAAGTITPTVAAIIAIICLVASSALAFSLNLTVVVILAIYLAIQILYNLALKRVPLTDVYCIASGFVLRACLGAAAINVNISGWLLFCTGALALMIGFGKRRSEFISQGEDRAATRQSLVHYTKPALDALVIIFATASSLCYAIYTLESSTATKFPALIITTPFVVYGITRYVLLVFTLDEGGEPEDFLFRDPHLLASIVLFAAAAAVAISGTHLPLIER